MVIPSSVVQKLQAIVKEDVNARHVFRQLAGRARARKEIDLYREKQKLVKGGIQLNDEQLLVLYGKLDRMGVGKLHAKRLPGHSVFVFNYTLHEVAEAALGSLKDAPVGASLITQGRRGAVPGGTRVMMQLRGHTLTLNLPAGFDRDDARAVYQFLQQVADENEGA